MKVTALNPLQAPASPAPAALPTAQRESLLNQFRTEMGSPVSFTAQAHHGWGGPPIPALPDAPVGG